MFDNNVRMSSYSSSPMARGAAKKTETDAEASPPLRRFPAQARSRRRYEAILDAAAHLFGEIGFDATTTEAIARRADTSIGSVYQFFPDKKAIFVALAQRNIGRSQATLERALSATAAGAWTDILEGVIDALVELLRKDAGFRAVWVNVQLYGAYAEAEANAQRDLIETVRNLLAARAPDLSREDHKVIASLVVNVTSMSLVVALQQRGARSERMIGEVKRMLVAYLATYLGD